MLRNLIVVASLLLPGVFVVGQAPLQMPGALDQIQEVRPISPLGTVLATSSPQELERLGDEAREQKDFLGAIDYYDAALKKQPTAVLHNKIGMTYLSMSNLSKAKKSLEKSIKLDKTYAEAYNNLGVVFYKMKKFGPSEKNYKKALAIRESASFHSNLGTLYVERKEMDRGVLEYRRAMELDPEVFERSSRTGIAARMSSPEDRARFFYTMAKLYASAGNVEKSLEYLKRAMEDGYPEINKVYKDSEFAELRKDQRFTELMAQRPAAIPQAQ